MFARTLMVVAFLVCAPFRADGEPARGSVKVESVDATDHDRTLFERVANDLAANKSLWRNEARGTKTFRLITDPGGGVRGLTEMGSTLHHVVACKLLRNRLWRLPMKGAEKRKVTVTFRFEPAQ
jgi:hypothetical protein